jgi:hypothetical protein
MNRQLLFILAILVQILPLTDAAASHFSDITPTNSWIHFAGKLSINNNDPVNGSDEVAVFVNNDNDGELIVGKTTVGNTVDNFYLISIYGDDAQTPQKDGAKPGDELIFKIWSSQDKLERTISHNQMSIELANGLTQPNLPPAFQATHLEQYGYLHLAFLDNLSETNAKYSVPTINDKGILCFMIILIAISISSKRKRLLRNYYETVNKNLYILCHRFFHNTRHIC